MIERRRKVVPGAEEEALDRGREVLLVEARRDYTEGPLLSQVLGYTGSIDAAELDRLAGDGYLADDLIGKTGVEATYESELRGKYGLDRVERDAAGRDLHAVESVFEPVAGDSLRLSARLKSALENRAPVRLHSRISTANMSVLSNTTWDRSQPENCVRCRLLATQTALRGNIFATASNTSRSLVSQAMSCWP